MEVGTGKSERQGCYPPVKPVAGGHQQGRRGRGNGESWSRAGGQLSSARSIYSGAQRRGAEVLALHGGVLVSPLGRTPGSRPTQEMQLRTVEAGTGKCSLLRS